MITIKLLSNERDLLYVLCLNEYNRLMNYFDFKDKIILVQLAVLESVFEKLGERE